MLSSYIRVHKIFLQSYGCANIMQAGSEKTQAGMERSAMTDTIRHSRAGGNPDKKRERHSLDPCFRRDDDLSQPYDCAIIW
jgi:hypothetical protein